MKTPKQKKDSAMFFAIAFLVLLVLGLTQFNPIKAFLNDLTLLQGVCGFVVLVFVYAALETLIIKTIRNNEKK